MPGISLHQQTAPPKVERQVGSVALPSVLHSKFHKSAIDYAYFREEVQQDAILIVLREALEAVGINLVFEPDRLCDARIPRYQESMTQIPQSAIVLAYPLFYQSVIVKSISQEPRHHQPRQPPQ
jgi:hypothetical protein